jgi:hypothetical protein
MSGSERSEGGGFMLLKETGKARRGVTLRFFESEKNLFFQNMAFFLDT